MRTRRGTISQILKKKKVEEKEQTSWEKQVQKKEKKVPLFFRTLAVA